MEATLTVVTWHLRFSQSPYNRNCHSPCRWNFSCYSFVVWTEKGCFPTCSPLSNLRLSPTQPPQKMDSALFYPFDEPKERVEDLSICVRTLATAADFVRDIFIPCVRHATWSGRPLSLYARKLPRIQDSRRFPNKRAPDFSEEHIFFHPRESSLAAQDEKFTVDVENALAVYAAEMFIGPLLRILNAKFSKLRFDFRSEVTLKFTATTNVDAKENPEELICLLMQPPRENTTPAVALAVAPEAPSTTYDPRAWIQNPLYPS